MIRYELIDEKRILLVKYFGTINKRMLISFIEYMESREDIGSLIEIISDFRDSRIFIRLNELELLAKARISHIPNLMKMKDIFLVSSPTNTALVTWLSKCYQTGFPSVKICSTIDYCRSFSTTLYSSLELDNKLNRLKFKFNPHLIKIH